MPTYVATITVPPTTPADKPVVEEISMRKGLLHRISIQIPPGHHALAGLRLCYGEMQLFPTEPGTWLRGDDVNLEFEERWMLPEDPTTIRIEGMNQDDTYEHSFIVRLCVLPPEEVSLRQMTVLFAERMMKGIRRLFGLP